MKCSLSRKNKPLLEFSDQNQILPNQEAGEREDILQLLERMEKLIQKLKKGGQRKD